MVRTCAAIVAASQTVDLSTQVAAGDDLYDTLLGASGIVSLIEADGYMVNGHIAALAMRGKLPWELMVFLEDARKLGVLCRAGACYQFRHGLVQDRLAEHETTSRTTRSAGQVLRSPFSAKATSEQ